MKVNAAQNDLSASTEEVQRTWKWFGNAGHFICAEWCRFHLCTLVNGYLVSTVGEYVPDESGREIHCATRGIVLNGRGDARMFDYMQKVGFQDIGYGRKYETMIFRAGEPCARQDCGCGLPEIDGHELWADAYNDAGSATAGHLAACARATVGNFEDEEATPRPSAAR